MLQAAILFVLLAQAPALPPVRVDAPISILQGRIYRQGPYLAVDGVVGNTGDRAVEGLEVSVEFYDFFGALLGVEHTLVRPPSLMPGQKATYRVVTPFSEDLRRARYRFTWRADGQQFQSELETTVAVWR
jgi:hypothetical protein